MGHGSGSSEHSAASVQDRPASQHEQPATHESTNSLRNDAGFNEVGNDKANKEYAAMTGYSSTSGNAQQREKDLAGKDGKFSFGDYGDIYGGKSDGRVPQANGDGTGHAHGADSNAHHSDGNQAQGGDSNRQNDANHVPYDQRTATYDGKQMYDLSTQDRLNLPEKTLAKVNENNVKNLEDRAANLGDRMPDVVFRGVGSQHSPNMEAVANNQNPMDQTKRDFAASKEFSSDPATQVSDMAANFSKAKNYAETQADGKLYAFAYNRNNDSAASSEFLQKSHQQFAPEPFAQSNNAAEKKIAPDTNVLDHITTLNRDDISNPDRMQAMTQSRSKQLDTYQLTHHLDKVMSAIESQHSDHSEGVSSQRENHSSQQTQQGAGWNRIPDVLKSWF